MSSSSVRVLFLFALVCVSSLIASASAQTTQNLYTTSAVVFPTSNTGDLPDPIILCNQVVVASPTGIQISRFRIGVSFSMSETKRTLVIWNSATQTAVNSYVLSGTASASLPYSFLNLNFATGINGPTLAAGTYDICYQHLSGEIYYDNNWTGAKTSTTGARLTQTSRTMAGSVTTTYPTDPDTLDYLIDFDYTIVTAPTITYYSFFSASSATLATASNFVSDGPNARICTQIEVTNTNGINIDSIRFINYVYDPLAAGVEVSIWNTKAQTLFNSATYTATVTTGTNQWVVLRRPSSAGTLPALAVGVYDVCVLRTSGGFFDENIWTGQTSPAVTGAKLSAISRWGSYVSGAAATYPINPTVNNGNFLIDVTYYLNTGSAPTAQNQTPAAVIPAITFDNMYAGSGNNTAAVIDTVHNPLVAPTVSSVFCTSLEISANNISIDSVRIMKTNDMSEKGRRTVSIWNLLNSTKIFSFVTPSSSEKTIATGTYEWVTLNRPISQSSVTLTIGKYAVCYDHPTGSYFKSNYWAGVNDYTNVKLSRYSWDYNVLDSSPSATWPPTTAYAQGVMNHLIDINFRSAVKRTTSTLFSASAATIAASTNFHASSAAFDSTTSQTLCSQVAVTAANGIVVDSIRFIKGADNTLAAGATQRKVSIFQRGSHALIQTYLSNYASEAVPASGSYVWASLQSPFYAKPILATGEYDICVEHPVGSIVSLDDWTSATSVGFLTSPVPSGANVLNSGSYIPAGWLYPTPTNVNLLVDVEFHLNDATPVVAPLPTYVATSSHFLTTSNSDFATTALPYNYAVHCSQVVVTAPEGIVVESVNILKVDAQMRVKTLKIWNSNTQQLVRSVLATPSPQQEIDNIILTVKLEKLVPASSQASIVLPVGTYDICLNAAADIVNSVPWTALAQTQPNGAHMTTVSHFGNNVDLYPFIASPLNHFIDVTFHIATARTSWSNTQFFLNAESGYETSIVANNDGVTADRVLCTQLSVSKSTQITALRIVKSSTMTETSGRTVTIWNSATHTVVSSFTTAAEAAVPANTNAWITLSPAAGQTIPVLTAGLYDICYTHPTGTVVKTNEFAMFDASSITSTSLARLTGVSRYTVGSANVNSYPATVFSGNYLIDVVLHEALVFTMTASPAVSNAFIPLNGNSNTKYNLVVELSNLQYIATPFNFTLQVSGASVTTTLGSSATISSDVLSSSPNYVISLTPLQLGASTVQLVPAATSGLPTLSFSVSTTSPFEWLFNNQVAVSQFQSSASFQTADGTVSQLCNEFQVSVDAVEINAVRFMKSPYSSTVQSRNIKVVHNGTDLFVFTTENEPTTLVAPLWINAFPVTSSATNFQPNSPVLARGTYSVCYSVSAGEHVISSGAWENLSTASAALVGAGFTQAASTNNLVDIQLRTLSTSTVAPATITLDSTLLSATARSGKIYTVSIKPNVLSTVDRSVSFVCDNSDVAVPASLTMSATDAFRPVRASLSIGNIVAASTVHCTVSVASADGQPAYAAARFVFNVAANSPRSFFGQLATASFTSVALDASFAAYKPTYTFLSNGQISSLLVYIAKVDAGFMDGTVRLSITSVNTATVASCTLPSAWGSFAAQWVDCTLAVPFAVSASDSYQVSVDQINSQSNFQVTYIPFSSVASATNNGVKLSSATNIGLLDVNFVAAAPAVTFALSGGFTVSNNDEAMHVMSDPSTAAGYAIVTASSLSAFTSAFQASVADEASIDVSRVVVQAVHVAAQTDATFHIRSVSVLFVPSFFANPASDSDASAAVDLLDDYLMRRTAGLTVSATTSPASLISTSPQPFLDTDSYSFNDFAAATSASSVATDNSVSFFPCTVTSTTTPLAVAPSTDNTPVAVQTAFITSSDATIINSATAMISSPLNDGSIFVSSFLRQSSPVESRSATLYQIDVQTNTIRNSVQLDEYIFPSSLAVSSQFPSSLFVAVASRSLIAQIDVSAFPAVNLQMSYNIPQPTCLAFDGEYLFVCSHSRIVKLLIENPGAVANVVHNPCYSSPSFASLSSIAADSANSFLYVADEVSGLISRISTETGVLDTTFQISFAGVNKILLSTDASGRLVIYASSASASNEYVVDGASVVSSTVIPRLFSSTVDSAIVQTTSGTAGQVTNVVASSNALNADHSVTVSKSGVATNQVLLQLNDDGAMESSLLSQVVNGATQTIYQYSCGNSHALNLFSRQSPARRSLLGDDGDWWTQWLNWLKKHPSSTGAVAPSSTGGAKASSTGAAKSSSTGGAKSSSTGVAKASSSTGVKLSSSTAGTRSSTGVAPTASVVASSTGSARASSTAGSQQSSTATLVSSTASVAASTGTSSSVPCAPPASTCGLHFRSQLSLPGNVPTAILSVPGGDLQLLSGDSLVDCFGNAVQNANNGQMSVWSTDSCSYVTALNGRTLPTRLMYPSGNHLNQATVQTQDAWALAAIAAQGGRVRLSGINYSFLNAAGQVVNNAVDCVDLRIAQTLPLPYDFNVWGNQQCGALDGTTTVASSTSVSQSSTAAIGSSTGVVQSSSASVDSSSAASVDSSSAAVESSSASVESSSAGAIESSSSAAPVESSTADAVVFSSSAAPAVESSTAPAVQSSTGVAFSWDIDMSDAAYASSEASTLVARSARFGCPVIVIPSSSSTAAAPSSTAGVSSSAVVSSSATVVISSTSTSNVVISSTATDVVISSTASVVPSSTASNIPSSTAGAVPSSTASPISSSAPVVSSTGVVLSSTSSNRVSSSSTSSIRVISSSTGGKRDDDDHHCKKFGLIIKLTEECVKKFWEIEVTLLAVLLRRQIERGLGVAEGQHRVEVFDVVKIAAKSQKSSARRLGGVTKAASASDDASQLQFSVSLLPADNPAATDSTTSTSVDDLATQFQSTTFTTPIEGSATVSDDGDSTATLCPDTQQYSSDCSKAQVQAAAESDYTPAAIEAVEASGASALVVPSSPSSSPSHTLTIVIPVAASFGVLALIAAVFYCIRARRSGSFANNVVLPVEVADAVAAAAASASTNKKLAPRAKKASVGEFLTVKRVPSLPPLDIGEDTPLTAAKDSRDSSAPSSAPSSMPNSPSAALTNDSAARSPHKTFSFETAAWRVHDALQSDNFNSNDNSVAPSPMPSPPPQ